MKNKIYIILILSLFSVFATRGQSNCFQIWSGSKQQLCSKLVSGIEGYNSFDDGKNDFNRYGSYYKFKVDSTGFYYAKKIDGRWWFIDPDGYAGINMAVTSTIGIPAGRKMEAHLMLKDIGFNGIGNFVTPERQTKDDYNAYVSEKMSYSRRSDNGGFFQRFRNIRASVLKRPFLAGSTKKADDIVTVFDPEFEAYCDSYAKEFAKYKDERELLGYFSDNEIYFGVNQLQLFITELYETDPNYQFATEFATSKGISIEKIKTSYATILSAIKEEFAGKIAERYFSVVQVAIKKYDPNHLYLGSRLHGTPRAIAAVVKQSAKYCDVVSVNFYDKTTPNAEITSATKWASWVGQFDKPCLVTEFYTKAVHPDYAKQPGAGYYVNNQEDRGRFYQNTCMELLESKYFIGWQYFRWQDDYKPTATIDERFSNKGIVDTDMNEYVDMTNYMKEFNSQVYRIIEHIDSKTIAEPETETSEIVSTESTYVSEQNSSENYGNEQILKIEGDDCKSILKFNVGVDPNQIYDAKIRLYCTSAVANQKTLVTAVKNLDWSELNITASEMTNNTAWSNTEGRLHVWEQTVNKDSYVEFNVRNWLKQNAIKGTDATFVLSSLINSSSLEFASDNHSDVNKRPALIIKVYKDLSNTINVPKKEDIQFVVIGSELHIKGLINTAKLQLYNLQGCLISEQTVDSNSKIELPSEILLAKLFSSNSIISAKLISK